MERLDSDHQIQAEKWRTLELMNFPPGDNAGLIEPKDSGDTKGSLEFVISSHSNYRWEHSGPERWMSQFKV